MKHDIYVLCVTLFLILARISPAQEQHPLKLDELIQESLKNNPDLQAARHQAEAAGTQIRQAKEWDPPQVGMEFFQTPIQSFPNPAEHSMEMDYYIQQMFFFPGKTSAMKRSAESSAHMMEQNYHSVEIKFIRELKTAYYELYFVQRKVQINADNQDLMRFSPPFYAV